MKPLMISFSYQGGSLDIIVKEDQRISDVIKVLKENNIIFFTEESSQLVLRSWRKQTFINAYLTFKQANIENGDNLQFMTN